MRFSCRRRRVKSIFCWKQFSVPLDYSKVWQYDTLAKKADMRGTGMSSKKVELESMSLDDLWALHEKISAILSARIKAEKHELEKRLAVLDRGVGAHILAGEAQMSGEKRRRKYPRVMPKYRNPQTSETWSGRGKLPRWLVAAMKSGRKMEEFRIGEGHGARSRQRS